MGVDAAIVADDLTGALDAAAPFVRAGRTAVVVIEPDLLDQWLVAANVLSVSTGTRDSSEEDAAHQVGRTTRSLASHIPRLWFKKIDSTLRGHVAAETGAMLRASGLRRAVICPAVPVQGRVVRDGRVFVHGVPLAQWLPSGEAEKLRHARDLPSLFDSLSQAGLDLAFPDVAKTGDFDLVARSIASANGAVLAVGASGLAAALAGPAIAGRGPVLEGPFLFVAGSMTRETAAQATALSAIDGAMIVRVGRAGDMAVDPAASVVLLAPDEGAIPPRTPAAEVAGLLAAAAEQVIGWLAPATILLTGGETAVAVLRRLGCGYLEVVGEIDPGVPVSAARFGGRPVHIVTKAGGFGTEDLFVRIADGG